MWVDPYEDRRAPLAIGAGDRSDGVDAALQLGAPSMGEAGPAWPRGNVKEVRVRAR